MSEGRNDTAIAVTSVKEQQQVQTFIVFKVLFHLSIPWASQLVHEGGKAGVIFLQQMKQQAELGHEAYSHTVNKEWVILEKLQSPHSILLIIQTFAKHLPCARYAPTHFKYSTH